MFLLSIKEVEQYFVSNEKRLCKPTKYAVNNGAYEDYSGDGGWWLRSASGDYGVCAAFVNEFGSVCRDGNGMLTDDSSVRPAFWLNL